jgi:PadR family transcriptional regulator PadR
MDSRFLDNWVTQLRKGILELCILSAMHGEKVYGYDIVKRLRAIEGLVIREGTIYPILSRLQREGLVTTSIVESTEGPARKYYELTDLGWQYLSRMDRDWQRIQDGVETIRKDRTS